MPAETVPNPGSDAALNAGCICPVLDNCHGRFPPYPPDGWVIIHGCPVHSPAAPQQTPYSPTEDGSQ